MVPWWGMLAALVVAFAMSQLYRTLPAIVAQPLAAELSLTPDQLGLFAGSFHIGFALMQIPVGVLLDRYGPRRVDAGLLFFAAAGALVTAAAGGAVGLLAGQFLLGAGCAACLMATLVFVARWQPPERFASLSGIVIALGNTGILISATPMGFLVAEAGWRAVFVGLGCTSAAVAALVYLLVRDAPASQQETARTGPQSFGSSTFEMLALMRFSAVRGAIVLSFVFYPALITVRGLWVGPFLGEAFGLSPVGIGNAVLLMSVAMIVGPITAGALDRRTPDRGLLITGSAAAAATILAALGLLGSRTLLLDLLLLPMLGLFASGYVLQLAAMRTSVGIEQAGRALALLNLATFFGVAVWQALSGLLSDRLIAAGLDPVSGYRAVFGLLALALLSAAIIEWRLRARRS